MARIPDHEVERLKREVSLVRLVEAAGIELKKHGGADLVGRCPFHDDKTPSLVVTPKANLWHCLGACQAGGSVVDWVMRFHRVSFRHACEMLLKEHPALTAPVNADAGSRSIQSRWIKTDVKPLPQSELRAAVNSFSLDAGDQALLNQVIGFYHETLKQSPEALAYLDKRGLHDPSLIERFRLGYANRTLAYRLPAKQIKAGAEQRGALQRIGILRESGHEHFNGSLVIPILDAEQNILGVYGRKIRDDLKPGTPLHLYLPGPHRGVFNRAGIEGQEEVILCEALIDALTFIAAGYTHVTTSYGVSGFTDEILQALKTCGARRILIAYDRDAAGDGAADKLAKQLQAEGLDCHRLLFPKGMDANAYACQVKPANKSLAVVIRSAQWMGSGAVPSREPAIEIEPSMPAVREPSVESSPAPVLSSLAALAAKEKIPTEPTPAAPALESPALPARAVGAEPEADVEAQVSERDVVIVFGDRRYRVRGLTKNTSHEVLKVNVLVSGTGEGLHVDSFDLYQAKARQTFAKQAAVELAVEESVIQRDLGQVLLKLEALQDELIRAAVTPKDAGPAQMAQAEEQAALDFLRAPDLIERIVGDFTRVGLVGEPTNALAGYLAAVSRKLKQPLAIIVQSTSAAGKSALMEAVLRLVPDEDRVHYSAMTGQSLFYLGEKDLKHKILAIAEEEGVRQASYALKLLQSQGELTIASTGKDPETGKLVTEEYRVEGPVMLFLTTTAIDLDEELLNRCLVLTVNESREQTRAIQALQRSRRTLQGLLAETEAETLTTLHRNAQRLLKPLAVVNPFAEQLTFLDERTRTRRDHAKYLTLIDAIALLHQHQREVKKIEHGGRTLDYIEVQACDIALANALAHEVLGRSLDELPPQTRRVLGAVCRLVEQRMEKQGLHRSEAHFTRKEVRESAGLSDTQARIHLERLAQMEYLAVHAGRNGARFVYELIFDGAIAEHEPRLPGLIEAGSLGTTTPTSRGQPPDLAGGSRGANGHPAASSRDAESGENPSADTALPSSDTASSENAHQRQSPERRSRTVFPLAAESA
jgi:DNA primase